MCREDLPMRQRPVKSPGLRMTFSSSSEQEELSLEKSRLLSVAHAQDIIFLTSSYCYLEAVLLLVVALAVVILLGVVVLAGGGVNDEVGGVAALEASPRRSPPLFAELVQGAKLPRQQGDLVVGDALILFIRSCGQKGQDKLQSR
jgi:hypothetical protein